jgi:hypothetical protein
VGGAPVHVPTRLSAPSAFRHKAWTTALLLSRCQGAPSQPCESSQRVPAACASRQAASRVCSDLPGEVTLQGQRRQGPVLRPSTSDQSS